MIRSTSSLCRGLGFNWAFVVLLIAGCAPAISDEELGEVILAPNKMPGAEGPYELPELPKRTPKEIADNPNLKL